MSLPTFRRSLPSLLSLSLLLPAAAFAATPSSGSIAPHQASPTTFIGGVPLVGVNETGGEAACIEGTSCEQYTLTVSGVPTDWTGERVSLNFAWLSQATEYDIYVHKGTLAGALVGSYTAGLTNNETVTLDPTDSAIGTGVFAVHVVVASGSTLVDNYTATISAVPAPPKPLPAVQATGLPPQYQIHYPTPAQIASGLGTGSGEPSIGVNWNSGHILYQALLQTLRVTATDACSNTPTLAWQQVQSPVTGTETFDPILFTDHTTGRTQISQLVFGTTESISDFTDDDGSTYLLSQGAGIASGIDHQTLGGGPFHAPAPTGATYPHAVYYCAQSLALNNCALSIDGGLTFGPAVPISTTAQCAALHGHVKVAPDGSAYVPDDNCNGPQGVIASQDNGMTWTVRPVPNSSTGTSDPSVAVDAGGRLYFGYADGDARPVVAMSNDHGATFDQLVDVGASQNIRAVEFSEMVAGDAGRAAFMFLGATAPGNPQDPAYPGVWHVYVASTFDGGVTWFTQDATPNAPVQRGPIWNGGGAVAYRNLLDFNDATYDQQGRFVAAVAEGCQGACALATGIGNGYSSQASIVRQAGGRGLVAAFDPPAVPTAPGAPQLIVVRDGPVAMLSWNQSNTGGSPIVSYAIQRGTAAGAETTIASVSGSTSRYVDTNVDSSVTYFYRVVASNAYGSNCSTDEVAAAYAGDSCTLPGLTVVTNPAGTQAGAPANTELNVRAVSVAEPYTSDGAQKLTFTMKVSDLTTIPPSANWRMIWTTAESSTNYFYVAMNSDSSSVVTFEYGQLGVKSEVVVGVSTFVALGVPDAASYAPDGTIQITVSNSKIGQVKPGDLVGNLVGRTYLLNASQTSRAAIDRTGPGNYLVLGNAYCNPANFTTTVTIEDDDPRIDYDNGWHQVANALASAGHYHYSHAQNGSAELNFVVPQSKTGAVTLNYGLSATGGGTATLYLDGAPRSDLSFGAGHGNGRDVTFGSSATLSSIVPGNHTVALINDNDGAINLDNFVLVNASALANDDGTEKTLPTSETSPTTAPAGSAVSTVTMPQGSRLSVLTETGAGGPIELLLIDPLGQTAALVQSSDGHASIDAPVPMAGLYTVQLVNLGTASITFYQAVTQTLPQ